MPTKLVILYEITRKKKVLPKISIITVVRNDPKGLELTLSNLTQLDYPNLELVVVDGASTDSTPRVAESFSEHIAHYISEPDSGLYDAMNKGLRLATGQYVWFVNAGDRALSGNRLVEVMTTDAPLCDVYFGEAVVVNESGQRLGLRRKKLPAELTWQSLKGGMVVCHQAFIAKRNIAPLYDLKYRYAADIEWQIQCLKASLTTQSVGVALCEFTTGGLSSQKHKESLVERWRIMRTHYGVMSTIASHIKFCFDAIFAPSYR